MGFEIKFNWVLQTDVKDDLKEGNIYEFEKTGNRAFPIETPIDLIDPERVAIAKISVSQFANISDKTTGKYKVLKIYRGVEKEILTNYWIENQ
jgi:hypothetical protein